MENYLPHIQELRKRLLLIGGIFIITFIIGFIGFQKIAGLYLQLFNLEGVQVVVTSPYQTFNLATNTGLFLAILVSTPVLIFQLISFLKPALHRKESKNLILYFISSLALFCVGFTFGLVIMKYVVLNLAISLNLHEVSNFWDVGLFLSQTFLTAALLGMVFQFPLILNILIKLDLIEPVELSKKRPYVILGIVIFVTMLPPTDAISLILMALPLIALYEITLLLLRRKGRR